jgi:O-antigen/teichoic acid export membrane protein
MSLLSERIVHWVYGSEYVQAGPVLAVVSFQIVGMFVGYVGGYMMMAINQQRKALWTDVSMRAREMAIDRGKRARGT